MKFAILAALVAVASASGNVKFTDCGHAEVKKLDVTGGVTMGAHDTIVLHKGKEVAVEAEFVANQDTSKMTIEVSASIDGLEIPIPGVNRDACSYVKCPVKKGETEKFSYKIAIPKLVPSLKDVAVNFKLNGEHGQMVCLSLKGAIEN